MTNPLDQEVRSFDHTRFLDLDSYRDLPQALELLARDLRDRDMDLPAFLGMVHDVAAVLFLGDGCEKCGTVSAAFRVEREGGGVRSWHRCPVDGSVWRCGHQAIEQPY